MYAIVETGGKQYRVSEGDRITVEKIKAGPGQPVEFDKVLYVQKDDGESIVGKPLVEGAKVVAKVEEQGKHKKILIFHYRHKVNYRKRYGHRQPFTRLVVEKVVLPR
ncbi:MAG: 50S ribosomal protein L21 [Firmicutes bacterium]|nr:50S ribosomal protein L21 [Bacillota bacterium]